MTLNIWLILDGKRGHEKQIEDLAFCITKRIKTNIIKIKKKNVLHVFFNFISIGNDPCKSLPLPDFILASGHQTHFDAIQKKNRYGGKLIIIMKPSLPSFLFDLIIMPAHDKKKNGNNIFVINNSINKITNLGKQRKNSGLFLIGGPSRNFYWSSEKVIDEINKIIQMNPNIDFSITTSRRTPDDFFDFFEEELKKKIFIYNYRDLSSDWIDKMIGSFEYSWVTQDSISMVSEMISAGSKVTCISLDKKNLKFKKFYSDLYDEKKINISDKKEQKVIISKNKKSTADICADFIFKYFNIKI